MSETTTVPQLKTRRPTGKPPWPLVLLAGVEKSGKSYAGAAFSASDLIDRTLWVEVGEGAADQYGALPGARYEIVEHDGSYRGIGAALRAATLQPRPNGKPHAIVLDSGTELWDLLAEEAQAAANERARRNNKTVPADGVQITMDLWNTAKKRWRHIVDLLRTYDGPVIITARLEQVTVMDAKGTPTTNKDWKIRAEKNLPFECDVVVKMPQPGTAILTGVRSLVVRSGLEVSDFSLEKLLTSMGLTPESTSPRSYTAPKPAPAELTVEQAVGQMRRRQADELPPEEDPWASEPPAESQPKPSTHAQRTKLVILVKDKRGATDDEQRHAVAGELLGREVGSFKLLSFDDASKLIDLLEREPDAAKVRTAPQPVAPNPRNGDLGKPLGPELFVPSLQSLLSAARGENGPTVAASLDALIAKAGTAPELAAIWRVADEAHKGGHVTDNEFANLSLLGQAKDRELSAAAAQLADEPSEQQRGVADRFANRIQQADTVRACADIAGALADALAAGNITQGQHDALDSLVEQREAKLRRPGQDDPGWSHRALDRMAGSAAQA
jgi:hypothetical protein